MESDARGADGSEGGAALAAAKQSLSAQYGVTSAFVRVAELSKMMGLPSNSIRALIREGAFPMEHRRVGRAALVKFDDFVRWYCQGGEIAALRAPKPKAEPKPEPIHAPAPAATPEPAAECGPKAPPAETPEQRVARWKREVRESLKARGLA